MAQVLDFFFEARGPREGLHPDIGPFWNFSSELFTLEKKRQFGAKSVSQAPVHFRAKPATRVLPDCETVRPVFQGLD